MTEQRVIDNVQTRLESLVTERFAGTYQNIDISCSSYNPDIDSTVTITVFVTDDSGNPIEDLTLPLKIDGTSIPNIITDSDGIATYNYTCTDWGVHKISVKSVSAFINVKGWRTFIDNGIYTGKYNDEYVFLNISATGIAFTSTWTEFAIDVIPDSNPDLRPAGTLVLATTNPRNFVRVGSTSRRIARATVAGQTLSDQSMYATFLYKRKEE